MNKIPVLRFDAWSIRVGKQHSIDHRKIGKTVIISFVKPFLDSAALPVRIGKRIAENKIFFKSEASRKFAECRKFRLRIEKHIIPVTVLIFYTDRAGEVRIPNRIDGGVDTVCLILINVISRHRDLFQLFADRFRADFTAGGDVAGKSAALNGFILLMNLHRIPFGHRNFGHFLTGGLIHRHRRIFKNSLFRIPNERNVDIDVPGGPSAAHDGNQKHGAYHDKAGSGGKPFQSDSPPPRSCRLRFFDKAIVDLSHRP